MRKTVVIVGFLTAASAASFAVFAVGPAASDPPPATLKLDVAPDPVDRGGEVTVRLSVVPASGVKINKHPKIKLVIPAQEGVAGAAEGSIGSETSPPPDHLEQNYFKSVDPVQVTVKLASDAKGTRELDGKVTYFYCVAASGYCAPAKVAVKIPVHVR